MYVFLWPGSKERELPYGLLHGEGVGPPLPDRHVLPCNGSLGGAGGHLDAARSDVGSAAGRHFSAAGSCVGLARCDSSSDVSGRSLAGCACCCWSPGWYCWRSACACAGWSCWRSAGAGWCCWPWEWSAGFGIPRRFGEQPRFLGWADSRRHPCRGPGAPALGRHGVGPSRSARGYGEEQRQRIRCWAVSGVASAAAGATGSPADAAPPLGPPALGPPPLGPLEVARQELSWRCGRDEFIIIIYYNI